MDGGIEVKSCRSMPPIALWRLALDTLVRGEVSGAAFVLVARQAIIMGLSVASSVAVSRWLGPDTVGRFAILIFVTQGILGYFGDLGLKASLIRKRGELSSKELATSQTIILVTSVFLASVIFAFLPWALRLTKLGPENYFPALVLLLLLILRNQRMVPLAMLERAMNFKVVSAIEAIESVIYTILLITLAFLHRGIWCYLVAMAGRDLFGTLAFHLAASPPVRGFSWPSIRGHVGFSLIYQGAALLNMATLAFPPIVIARLMGKVAVGYVAWASALALYPLVICNAMTRIYLPAFSSAASDLGILRARVENSLRLNASIAWPICAVLGSLSAPIISTIFTTKWLPAQMMLWAYCVTAAMTAVGLPLTELFFSQNDAWFNFRLCMFWTIPTWTLGTYSTLRYGLSGFAAFQATLQLGWLFAFWHAREVKGLKVFAPLLEPAVLVAAVVCANLLLIRFVNMSSLARLAVAIVVEAGLCGAVLVRTLLRWARDKAIVSATEARGCEGGELERRALSVSSRVLSAVTGE
ncbi:MAG: oligosaccharide flippase family protein [Terriglobales bacterium]